MVIICRDKSINMGKYETLEIAKNGRQYVIQAVHREAAYAVPVKVDIETFKNKDDAKRLLNVISTAWAKNVTIFDITKFYEKDITNENNQAELIGCFIDIFEDFLDKKGVKIDNPEKEGDETEAIIYGYDYDDISDSIRNMLICNKLI